MPPCHRAAITGWLAGPLGGLQHFRSKLGGEKTAVLAQPRGIRDAGFRPKALRGWTRTAIAAEAPSGWPLDGRSRVEVAASGAPVRVKVGVPEHT